MTRAQLILAGVALVLWTGAYFWFFHGEFLRWLQRRAARRVQAAKQRAEFATRQAKLREELARHLPPGPGPGAAG